MNCYHQSCTLVLPGPRAQQQEKSSDQHLLFALDADLGPGTRPRHVRKVDFPSQSLQSHTRSILKGSQPFGEQGLLHHPVPQGSLSHCRREGEERAPLHPTAPAPTPQVPAFPSKGPQPGRPEKTHPTSSLVGGEQLSPSAERLHRPDFRQGGQLSPNPRFLDERGHTWHGVAWPRQQSPAPGKSRP